MRKAASFLAAVVAGTCFSTVASASVGPLLSNQSPADLPSDLSAAAVPIDPQLEVGGEVGILRRHPNLEAHTVVVPTLSLRPGSGHITIYTEFTVGRIGQFRPEQPNTFTWRSPASTHFEDESRFLRSVVVGKDFFETLGERFDMLDDDERPWSTTTTVHMLASTKDWLTPFATLAYEEDSLEAEDRFGLGGGIQFNFDRNRNTTFGTEVIYFGDHVNASLPRETRFLAKFEIDF
ncbi:MAG: hypothetical protein ACTHN5_10735 [Phycisphaerae bacterium]